MNIAWVYAVTQGLKKQQQQQQQQQQQKRVNKKLSLSTTVCTYQYNKTIDYFQLPIIHSVCPPNFA